MEIELTARKVSQATKEGFERLANYRGMRCGFIQNFVGQYYNKPKGMTGEYPINLIFMAIRALVPNLVMKHGVNKITTDILAQKEKAEILGLGLDKSQKQRNLKKVLRAGLVNMFFGFSMFKTSIWASGELLPVGDDIDVDPGQIFTDLIDNDDIVIDPTCRELSEAGFIGHNVRISRLKLLEQGFDEELVLQLPSASHLIVENGKVRNLSQASNQPHAMYDLQDFVNVVELWVPESNVICYIPNPYQTTFDNFLKINDYYGPAEGPYTFGSLTPPVPDNPLPVAPVGVWKDLNDISNRVFKKFMDQGDRQKDILLYRPGFEDVAETIRTLPDGDTCQTDDPSAVNVVSFGGQNQDTERMVSQLQFWFNYLAGNPDQIAGFRSNTKSKTATESQLMQANTSVVIEDSRDIIADVNASISKKESWFMLHDPLINMPLTKRGSGDKEVQIWLTPEQQQSDWAEYTFSIVKRSMQVMEPALRQKLIVEFHSQIMPMIAQTAQICMQLGIPYNITRAAMQAAEELGIEDIMVEVFNDPTFEQRMELFMQQGPQEAGKGQMAGVMQNQGNPMARPVMSPEQNFNKQAQETAAVGQAAWGGM